MLQQKFVMQWDPIHSMELPARVSVPRLVEVARDLFDGAAPWWIDEVFLRMAQHRQHTYLVSTRHPGNLRAYVQNGRNLHEEQLMGAVYEPLPNVWLGVCCDSRASLLTGAKVLGETDAHLRWLRMAEWNGDYVNGWDAFGAVATMDWVVLDIMRLPVFVLESLEVVCGAHDVPIWYEHTGDGAWPNGYTPPQYLPNPEDDEVGDGLEDI